jgi:hypothetical protein
MTLHPIPSEFPYSVYEENFVFFFKSVEDKAIAWHQRKGSNLSVKVTYVSMSNEFNDAKGYTDKKENEILLIYREIQMGSVAKSFMRKGFLIH